MTLEEYIHHWKLEVWETCFSCKFKPKGGICCSKSWEQQYGGKEALKKVIYRCHLKISSFYFFSLSYFVFTILHSIWKIRIFSICISFLCYFTMFLSPRVRLMTSPIYYKFGEIQKQTTPCTTRISSRISPHTILKTSIGTLITFKIVPYHLKLCLEKATSPTSKTSLLALGVQTFKQIKRYMLQKGRGKRRLP